MSNPASPPPPNARFSWPMRLFLGFLLFWIAFRSLILLVEPDEIVEALKVDEYPTSALPAPNGPDAPRDEERYERTMAAFDSAWDFLKPWPGPRSRRQIKTAGDVGLFAIAWAYTRLGWLENLTGTSQAWFMFCPEAPTGRALIRARLIYADGEERTVRGAADPADLTSYTHLFDNLPCRIALSPEKGYWACCAGYCNFLKHRYPHNDAGSPLDRIRLYEVRVEFPPPGVDPCRYMREQQARIDVAERGRLSDFFEYKVGSGAWEALP